jgi:hypothetical protein
VVVSANMAAQLAADALLMAVWQRGKPEEWREAAVTRALIERIDLITGT